MSANLIWNNLVAYSLQIGLLVGLAAFVPAVLRLRLPGARLVYWHVLLAACLLLPLVRPWKQEVAADVQISTSYAVAVPAQPAPHRSIPRSEIALWLLAAGALARLGWLAAGFWRLRQYRRHSRPLEPASSWSVEADLRISGDVASPVTFGVRRPVVLLPARFPELGAPMQEAILCHEILHVRRRDWLFMVMEELVRAVFWFHPAIWWLLGEIGLAREQAVDRQVIDLTKSREEYVDALLAIAGARPRLDLALAPLFLRKRHLKQRVISVLKEVRMSRTRLISALAAGLGILVAACWFVTGTFPLAAAPQVVNDAPGVTVDLGGAGVMHRMGVAYPEAARKQGVQGTVVVEVKLDANGNVSDAHVVSGPEELRNAALQSVLQWHLMKNLAMSSRQVSISFRLPEAVPTQAPAAAAVPTQAAAAAVLTQAVAAAAVRKEAPPPQLAWVGRKVKAIHVIGLSDELRADLLSQLPVHEGDALSVDSWLAVARVVKGFDEHLSISTPSAGSNEVMLEIAAPGGVRISPEAMATALPAPSADTKRLTIGGNVQQTKLVSQVRPVYPPEAKQAHIQGVVKLRALIGKDGAVQNLEVISGHPLLVQAALDAVKQWVYQPTLLNGEPVEVVTQIDVNFTLSQ
ncbi:MAG: M56 family metallopeptidase [Bryobacteraceae bacterium]|jgi:protein TonB